MIPSCMLVGAPLSIFVAVLGGEREYMGAMDVTRTRAGKAWRINKGDVMTENNKLNEKPVQLLYKAINEEDIPTLIVILDENPGMLDISDFGKSLLHEAAHKGSFLICQLLIERGLNIDVVDDVFMTPLDEAVEGGGYDLMRYLYSKGARIDGHPRGVTTPLITCAILGYLVEAKFLIENGADVNRVHSRWNQTALDVAISWGQYKTADYLISVGGLRAQEAIDFYLTEGGGILEHIYNNVGPILSSRIPIDNIEGVELRTALIGNGKKHKLIFTMGLSKSLPRCELMMCLPFDWPIHKFFWNTNCNFPMEIIAAAAQSVSSQRTMAPGTLISKNTFPNLSKIWLAGLEGLTFVDYQFSCNSKNDDCIGDDELVSIIMLAPVSKKVVGCEVSSRWLLKARNYSWGKVSLSKFL